MSASGRQASPARSPEYLADYFDAIYIIHIPNRTDRLVGLNRELRRIGTDLNDTKVQMGCADVPADADGFPSAGVRGCYLSHLMMLQDAYDSGYEQVLILEDDAIFGRRMQRMQKSVGLELAGLPWDICHLGHLMPGQTGGLVRIDPESSLTQLHCYAVHRRVLPKLLAELKLILSRPAGHPQGGKMHVDGAFHTFRRRYPEVMVLAAFPSLSAQRSILSSLATQHRYERIPLLSTALAQVRKMRDIRWRLS